MSTIDSWKTINSLCFGRLSYDEGNDKKVEEEVIDMHGDVFFLRILPVFAKIDKDWY